MKIILFYKPSSLFILLLSFSRQHEDFPESFEENLYCFHTQSSMISSSATFSFLKDSALALC